MRALVAALAVTACVSPSRARYLHGGFASVEDSAEATAVCHRRVATTPIAPREAIAIPVEERTGVVVERLTVSGPRGRLRIVVRPAMVVPVAQLEVAPPQPVSGFVYGIDLRPYKRIAFVVDSGGTMCTAPSSAPNAQLPIDRAADELIAAVSGLPAATSFMLFGTASGIHELVPSPGENGRRAAMQWACNLSCSGDTSPALALLNAFAEQPDVIVMLSTDGAAYQGGAYQSYREIDDQLYATNPENVLDRVAHTVPVIAIDLGYQPSPHLAAIAQKTGGLVVRP